MLEQSNSLSVEVRVFILVLIHAYRNMLFLRIILSWVPMFGIQMPAWLRPALNFTYDLTEPFLRLFRRFLPTLGVGGMGLDLSPLLAFLALHVIAIVVERILF